MNVSKKSLFKGLAIAPLAAPVLYSVLALALPQVREHTSLNFVTWLQSLVGAILLSYIICLLIGAPLIYLLKRFNKLTTSWVVIASGIAFAITMYLFFFLLLNATPQGSPTLIISAMLFVSALLGSLNAWVFCKVSGITKT